MSAFDTVEMSVIKRNGTKETMSFDKILKRIKKMGMMGVVDKDGGIKINYSAVAMKIISQLYDGISSNMLDEITAEQLVNMSSSNPDYETLATRIVISNHHKNTNPSFSKTMKRLREEDIVSEEFYKNVQVNTKALDAMCDFQRDYLISYFGFKTLEKSYLLSIKKKVMERPQYLFMRVAIALHGTDLEKIQDTYDSLSNKFCIHGTPTLYNAGTNRQQMSSCFVKDTMVHTLRGPVPIQDVKIGDQVITHTGHVQQVKQVHTNALGDRQLYEVAIYKTNLFTVTEDHNLYVYDSLTEVADWKAVRDLKPNTDFVMIPKNKYQLYTENEKKKNIDDKINRFFGMWLRHGGFLYCDKKAEDMDMNVNIGEDIQPEETRLSEDLMGIELTLPNTPEMEETIAFCSTDVSRMFGDVMVEKHHAPGGRIQIRFLHKPMARDFMAWFNTDKTIPPGFFSNATHWIKALLSGWNVVPEDDTVCANDIYTLCRLHGIDHTTFLPLDHTEDSQVIVHDGFVYLQFMSSSISDWNDPEVYTLGVESDHSYSIEGIIAQNCYLIAMEEDSIEGIYNTLRDCALISKWAGGIGLHIHNIRATGSHIAGTNGVSNGIVPMLRVFNHTAKYVDQCVHPDTIIYTTQGPKSIQHVVEGETAIFNQLGQTEVIQKVLEHQYAGDMLEIETAFSGKFLDITPEHPVYAVRGGSDVEERINHDRAELEWIDAGKLELGDLIAYPIPTYEKDISGIDHEDCYMYGVMLNSAQGSSLHVSNMSLPVQEFLQNYLTKKCVDYDLVYEVNDQIVYSDDHEEPETEVDSEESKETNHVLADIMFRQSSNLPFRHSDLYNEEGNRHIASRWLNLPIAKSCMILKGLIDSGGSIEHKIYYETTSPALVRGLRFLCLRFGVLTTMFGGDNISHISSISIPVTPKTCTLFGLEYDDRTVPYFRYKDCLLNPITSIVTHEYEGLLYDLQMTEQHDYLLGEGLVHNGGGKRNGSFAIYMEPWHADIEVFLQMRKNHGEEELKARDLFYALWVPDLFMKRIKAGGKWTLMCPHECPGLADVWGDEFEALYTKYEEEGRGRSTVQARDLWFKVLDAQMETGTPYLLYKDAANRKSNQQNLGTIKSSNLCSEIIQYSDENETSVCFTADTQILTKEGYRRIDECDGMEVLSYFNNDSEFKETQQFVKSTLINNGMKDVYELECFGIKPIKTTANHLFAVMDKRDYNKKTNTYQWKQLKELTEDDRIIIPKTNIIPNYDNEIFKNTEEDYLTIGWLLGDGWQCKKSKNSDASVYGVCFGPNEIYARDRVLLKLNEWLDNCEFEKYGNNKRTTEYRTDKRTGVFSWASSKTNFVKHIQDNFGLMEHTAHFKVIPDKIKKSSPKEQASFLSGLFSADGNVFITNKNNRTRFNVNLASSSKFLLNDVQNMLKCFGIESRIVFGNVKNRTNQQGKISIDNKDSIINYHKYINFVLCKEKQDTLEYGIKTIKKKEMFTGFTKVKSITHVGKEIVYDLNVPDTHNFVAEGFVVHNCNLASIALPTFVENGVFDFDRLHKISRMVTRNLNRVIDINYYPTPKTELSNFRHRPIGLGVQGLADTFIMMDMAFGSEPSRLLNKQIFETIYHAGLVESCEIAKVDGHYETFPGSPASEGRLQFDLWDAEPLRQDPSDPESPYRYDWTALKTDIVKYGIRNSLLLAPMPTASTSQILGFNECIEPITSNIFSRRTMAGEFIVTNKYLMRDLIQLGVWNEKIKNHIIANNGSIQGLEMVPQHILDKYKTVWEIPMRTLIDMSADRGIYIDQSQSLNLWIEDPNYNSLTSMHFYSWSKGLKTGIYYLRRRAKHQAQQFTIEPEKANVDHQEEDDICEMCSG